MSLEKYARMSQPDNPPITISSKPSNVWTTYLESTKQFNDLYGSVNDTRAATAPSEAAIAAASTPYARLLSVTALRSKRLGGDPDLLCTRFVAADKYMANTVTLQYKAAAVATGIYSVRCTEGVIKGQAEEARNAALSMQFRMKQRSTVNKFADYVETRRKAIVACKGCSYEEALISKYPASARAMVTGASEAKATCSRYAVSMDDAERYMTSSVDNQLKRKAVATGVYDVICSDGNARNVAEYKRVSSLGAKFRIRQLSTVAKEQMKFDASKYAREFFGHGCDYEERLFNKYPAVSVSMRN